MYFELDVRTHDLNKFFTIFLILFSHSALAKEALFLDWDNLRPAFNQTPVVLPDLTPAQLKKIQKIYTLKFSSREDAASNIKVISKELAKEGIDTEEVFKLREQYILQQEHANQHLSTEYDGRNVRIPGFLVPIEYSAPLIATEFLLVPVAGACIHLPPPPPNQVVRVSYPKGFEIQTIQYPVWVEGIINSKLESADLYLVDGETNVTMGYTLEATKVVDYSE